MDAAMVNSDVNSTVVRAMASTAMMFRARAARMERDPSRRMQLLLDTFITALTPVSRCGRPRCG